MLVLSRKREESITIVAPDGTKIVLQILYLGKERMRVGIEAPKEYNIYRTELEQRSDFRGTSNAS